MIKICEYRFDTTIDKNLIPSFNVDFVNYTMTDIEEDENIIKRTIYHEHSYPTLMSFNEKKGLIEFLDGDTREMTNFRSMFGNCLNARKLNVSNFDTRKATSLHGMFYNCQNVIELNVSNFDTRSVEEFSIMFYSCQKLENLDVSNFNTENATTLAGMFEHCRAMTSLNLLNFKTPRVRTMNSMFAGCSSLTTLNLSSFETGNVTQMQGIFSGCSKLISVDISSFDTRNVTQMQRMFSGCLKLTSIDVSHFDTRNVTQTSGMFADCRELQILNLSSFNTSKVKYMYEMFQNCYALTELNLSNFDTTQVETMSYLFEGCYALQTLDISNFNTQNVTRMNGMFANCRAISNLNLQHFDTRKVTLFQGMFESCLTLTELDLSSFNTEQATNLSVMFKNCQKLTCLTMSSFNTHQVTHMLEMFMNCYVLEALEIRHFNTKNVTNMNSMFEGCRTLTTLDVSNFDTRKVTSTASMFMGCSALTTLEVSNFDLSQVTNARDMFRRCQNLIMLDASNFNLVKNKYFQGMFAGCNRLKFINLSRFRTDKAVDLSEMFYNCYELISIDVSSFKTENVTNMYRMFNGCYALKTLDLSNFDTRKVNIMADMFYNCRVLTTLDVSSFNTSNVTDMTNMFRNLTSLAGLDLSNFDTRNLVYANYLFCGSTGLKWLDLSNFHLTANVERNSILYECDNLIYIGMLYCDLTTVDLLTQTLTNSLEKEVYLMDVDPTLPSERPLITFKRYRMNHFSFSAKTESPNPDSTIVLHGEGELKDTLDAKGSLTSHFEEIHLTSALKWKRVKHLDTQTTIFFAIDGYQRFKNLSVRNRCTTLTPVPDLAFGDRTRPYIIGKEDNEGRETIFVGMPKKNIRSVEDFNEWLDVNPTYFLAELKTPMIKKIELTSDTENHTFEYCSSFYGAATSSTLPPLVKYKLQSNNSFVIDGLKKQKTYTLYYKGSPSLVTCGGERNILLRSPQVITSGSSDQILYFDDIVDQVRLIEGDTTSYQIPYFLGTLDVVNPIIRIDEQEFLVPFTLKSSGTVKDQFNLLTGEFIQRISEDHQILQEPMSQIISVPSFSITSQSKISLFSYELSLLPIFSYICRSSNHYPINIDANQIYTIKCKRTRNGTMSVGGVLTSITGNQIISTQSSDHRLLFNGDLGVRELIVVKGDVRNVLTPYFLGLKSVVNPTLWVTNGASERNALKTTLTLRKLSDEIKDEFDVVSQVLIKRVGERAYRVGDETLNHVLTDGKVTLYPLSKAEQTQHRFKWSNGQMMSFDQQTHIFTECVDLYPHLYVKLPISTVEEIIRRLKLENESLQEENISTMMAITEVFEMIMYIVPSEMATINIAALTNADMKAPKGGFQMVEVYVTLILKGKKTLDQVPAMIRPKVEAQLAELGALEA